MLPIDNIKCLLSLCGQSITARTVVDSCRYNSVQADVMLYVIPIDFNNDRYYTIDKLPF